jgi:hypothetical protein
MGCSTVRPRSPMKRIIILAVGSYRSFYVALAPDLLSNGGPTA